MMRIAFSRKRESYTKKLVPMMTVGECRPEVPRGIARIPKARELESEGQTLNNLGDVYKNWGQYANAWGITRRLWRLRGRSGTWLGKGKPRWPGERVLELGPICQGCRILRQLPGDRKEDRET